MGNLETPLAILALSGCLAIGGCYPSGRYIRTNRNYAPPTRHYNQPTMPGNRGSSYSVTRDCNGRVISRQGAVWNKGQRGYRVGLPRNPTPANIQRKYQRDVEHMRRQRRRR